MEKNKPIYLNPYVETESNIRIRLATQRGKFKLTELVEVDGSIYEHQNTKRLYFKLSDSAIAWMKQNDIHPAGWNHLAIKYIPLYPNAQERPNSSNTSRTTGGDESLSCQDAN